MASSDLIDMFLANMRERGRTDDSIDSYNTVLQLANKNLPYGVDVANEEELRAWIWRDGLANNSRVTYVSILSGFFKWANAKQHLDFNPMENIDAPKTIIGHPRVATDEHVAIATTTAPFPYRTWATLAAYEGMRCIEVARCHREHITEETTRIYKGKGNKPRIVKTHPLVWEAVEPLLPGPITDKTADEISSYFIRWTRREGLLGLSMHRLRGWFATQGYRTTKDIRAVQRNLGHADPGTTARYIDITDDEMAAAVTGLPTFAPASVVPEQRHLRHR